MVNSTSEENKTDERLSELLTIRLDTYIKNPDNASEEENIKRDKLVVAFIVLNMLNEFVFRILGFVVLYSFLIKA